MFYETAQTIGPGWHRSYKPSYYEDMSWSPSSRNFRSPGSSPETYRRIIRNDEDFPSRSKHEDEFFSGRKSPTFPRRIFKEVWNESPSSNQRFVERPRMFKRVFRPSQWEEDFDSEVPNLRRVEREFDRKFDDGRPSRKFDDEFGKHFNARDLKKDIEDEFEKSEGRVHHIPIMVERKVEEMKSRFGRNSPPSAEEECSEEWEGPQVQRLRKTFEPDEFSRRRDHYRFPRDDFYSKARTFASPIPETWDPHAVHTLPTRKGHKSSQSFDDARHPVSPKHVYRSFSETHEDAQKPQQQHSAAFRSHSDGHCPNKTYITKIDVNQPTKNENDELRSSNTQDSSESTASHDKTEEQNTNNFARPQRDESPGKRPFNQFSENPDEQNPKPKCRNKYDSPGLQQIAVVLQNVGDLVHRVEAYNGTSRDKQFRFLDEMLTRCMLRLDDVDTEGREDIRNARKAAVREVQSCLDKLEAKANESERRRKSKVAPLKEETSSKAEAKEQEKPKVIPLPDVIDRSGENEQPQMAFPLGGVNTNVGENELRQMAIPLGDSNTNVDENELRQKAIPLGDVPRKNENDEGVHANGCTGTSEDDAKEEKGKVENNEQTKL